jgi:hypothetical protein
MSSGSGYLSNLGSSVYVDLDVIFKLRPSTESTNNIATGYAVNGIDISSRYELLSPYQANSNGTSFKTPITTGYKLTNGSDLNTIFCRADYPEIVLNGSGVLASDIVNNSLGSVSTPVVIVIEGYTSIDEGAFADEGAFGFGNNFCIIQVTIPNTVTSLGRAPVNANQGTGTFYGCTHLSTVIFESGSPQLTLIGAYTFWQCYNLVSIKIPSTVTHIDFQAFSSSGLISIIIPESVEYIGQYTFSYSNQLLYVIFEGNSNISKQTFDNASLIFSNCNSLTTVYCTQNTLTNWGLTAGPNQAISGSNLLNIIEYDVLLSGTGELANGGTVSYQASILIDGYTSIGQSAFQTTSVGLVIIPNSVTSIGEYAFQNCQSLTSITFTFEEYGQYPLLTSIGQYAFSSCQALTSITTIPRSVTSIGQNAFYNCQALTSITFGQNSQLTSIGQSAFSNCQALTSITIPDLVTFIDQNAFTSCLRLSSISIPESVTSIGLGAFNGCSTLKEITIPNSVTFIGQNAFADTQLPTTYNSDGLILWYVPTDTTSFSFSSWPSIIGSYALSNTNVTLVSIPDSVTSIGEYAFQYCQALTSITFTFEEYGQSPQLTSIGTGAFYYCSALTSISIPYSVTSIGQSAFYYCVALTSITFPPYNGQNSQLTSIGSNAFSVCQALATITIPSSVTSIGSYAFNTCQYLTLITIPDSVKSIGDFAFYGCQSLQLITIPDSVTYIDQTAFLGSGITKVTMSSGNSLNITSPSNGTISIGGATVTVRPSYQITSFRQATYQSESNSGIYRIIFNNVDETTFDTIQTKLIGINGEYLNGQLTITYADYENNIQFIYSGTLTLNFHNSNNNPIYKGSSSSNTVGFIFYSTPTLTNVYGTGDVLTSTETYTEYFGSSSNSSNSIIPTSYGGHVYISY